MKNSICEGIQALYINWLYKFICTDCIINYDKLLRYLHGVDFYYLIDDDENRYEDGINLRYHFGQENNISDMEIMLYLDSKPCSMLEMLVALASRCEVQIMGNQKYGDRTVYWFWLMINNIGLGDMDDTNFNEYEADILIKRLLNRKYEANGKGGLFEFKCDSDLREISFWYQLCWYLDTRIKEKKIDNESPEFRALQGKA